MVRKRQSYKLDIGRFDSSQEHHTFLERYNHMKKEYKLPTLEVLGSFEDLTLSHLGGHNPMWCWMSGCSGNGSHDFDTAYSSVS